MYYLVLRGIVAYSLFIPCALRSFAIVLCICSNTDKLDLIHCVLFIVDFLLLLKVLPAPNSFLFALANQLKFGTGMLKTAVAKEQVK